MDKVTFRPEPEIRTVWLIILSIGAFLALLVIGIVWAAEGVPGGLMMMSLALLVLLPMYLYLPAYYKTLEYGLDSDAVRMKGGVFWKRDVTVTYGKITNLDITQGPLERAFGIYKLHIQTAGAGGQQGQKAELVLAGIKDASRLKDRILANLKQTNSSKISIPESETLDYPDNRVLGEILEELKKIRQNLEK